MKKLTMDWASVKVADNRKKESGGNLQRFPPNGYNIKLSPTPNKEYTTILFITP